MRHKVLIGLLAAAAVLALPALATTTSVSTATDQPAVSDDLTIDEFLQSGVVSTELVSAVRCPEPLPICQHANDDCGATPGTCHCKAGGGTLTCVGNPTGGGGPIE